MPSPFILDIYKCLPYFAKFLIANFRGIQLKKWRYGRKTEQLINEFLSHESWNKRQWETWQEEKISQLLFHAERNVPYYREYWAKQKRLGNKSSSGYLENWPILEKDVVRQNPKAFLVDNADSFR